MLVEPTTHFFSQPRLISTKQVEKTLWLEINVYSSQKPVKQDRTYCNYSYLFLEPFSPRMGAGAKASPRRPAGPCASTCRRSGSNGRSCWPGTIGLRWTGTRSFGTLARRAGCSTVQDHVQQPRRAVRDAVCCWPRRSGLLRPNAVCRVGCIGCLGCGTIPTPFHPHVLNKVHQVAFVVLCAAVQYIGMVLRVRACGKYCIRISRISMTFRRRRN